MALSDLTANLITEFNWSAERSNGAVFATSVFRDAYRIAQALTFGASPGMVNQMFCDERTITVASLTDDIDLSGVLANVFGETITFREIAGILIYNLSTVIDQVLYVGGKSGNGWTAPFGASSISKDTVLPSGIWTRGSTVDSYPVVAGSSDVLRIQNGGNTSITYDIIIFGVQ